MILLVTPQIFDEADELLAPWSAVLDGAPVMRFGFSAAAVLALGAMNWLVCDQDRKDTQVTAEKRVTVVGLSGQPGEASRQGFALDV
ncbi:protein of unknown function [Methylorubrum extorquens DM4]|nr:protein of unknown function [Methylorubrum extorquens DM4]